jgi:L-iditol 2-dehydrogenase
MARLLGCGKLIAIDRFPSRLALAEEFGATLTLNVEETDAPERLARVREHTGGLGADVVADCSGVPQTLPDCLRVARVGGVVVEAGAFVDLGPVGINPTADICTKNVCVIGVGGETSTSYAPVMQLLARDLERLPLERVVTHRFGLEEAPEALEVSQANGAMKVMMVPHENT